MEEKKRYKLEHEYKKSNTKTIPLVLSSDLLEEIQRVEKEVLKGKYSRSLILRESIKIGLPLLLENLENEK